MGVAGHRQRFVGCAIEADVRGRDAMLLQRRKFFFQPQTRRDQDLVIAAAPRMDLSTDITQTFGQPRLDGRMAVFELLVQHERAAAEIASQRVEFTLQRSRFTSIEHADVRQPFDVCLAGRYVVQEELAVEQHVVAGEEAHDLRIDLAVGFLPEWTGHRISPVVVGACRARDLDHADLAMVAGMACCYRAIPVNSSMPSARLMFCIACVAAPFSKLSSVATMTTRRPSADNANPPISAWCRPAIRLTHGGSSTIRTSTSSPYAS